MTRQGLQQREPRQHAELSNVCSSTDRGDQGGGGHENGFEVQFLSQFWNELDLSLGEGSEHLRSHFGSHEKGGIDGGNQGSHTNSRNGHNTVFSHKEQVPASFEPHSFDTDQVWADFDDSEIDVMGRGEVPQESTREGRFSSFKPEDRSLTSQRRKRRTSRRGHSSQTDSFRTKQAHASVNEERESFGYYNHLGKLICVRPFGGQEQKDDDTETTSSRSNTHGGATSSTVPHLSFHRDRSRQEKEKTSPSNKRFVNVDQGNVKLTTTQDAEPTQPLDTVSRKWAPQRLFCSLESVHNEKERHVTRCAVSKPTTGTIEIKIPKKKFSPKRLICSANSGALEYEPQASPADTNKEDLHRSRFMNSTSSNVGDFENRIGDAGGIQRSNRVGQIRTSNMVSHQEKMVYEPDMKGTRRSPKSSTNVTSHSEDWTQSTWSPSHLLCIGAAERVTGNHDANSRRNQRSQRDAWYVRPGIGFDPDERRTMDMVFFDTNF